MTDTPTADAPAPEPKTPLEARQRLNEIARDPDWSKRLVSGDQEAIKTSARLSELAVKEGYTEKVTAALAGTLQPLGMEVLTGQQLSSHDLIAGIQQLREMTIEDKQINRFLRRESISREDRQFVENYRKELLGSAEFRRRLLDGDIEAQRLMLTANGHLLRPIAGQD